MESNGSEQHRKYDRNKGLLGDYAGRQHFPVSGSERRPWRTKRKFPGEDQMYFPSSSTHDRQSRFGNNRSYDPNMPPHGWLDCPAYGEAIDYIIPSKVPLRESFNEHIPTSKRYAPEHAIQQQRLLGREFGMVIDLTNTHRYYYLSAWSKEGIRHVKIRCTGKDAAPDDASVDKFVREVSNFCSQGKPEKFILVHCTHGHNRTGYMIAHYLIRTKSISVTEAIDTFAKARPPGIYKDDYIDSLYRYYGEKRPEVVICPQTPEWKRSPGPDISGEAVQDPINESTLLHNNGGDHVMTNDDLLGVRVSSDQIRAMRQTCYQLLKVARGNQQFPGSHPVSLNRVNMQLLRQKYYYATWKADGTRYMMLITCDGCYLIDRNFSFRRIDMRFPCKQTNKGTHDQTHHYTLLDGEMVIDMDSNTQKQERRYLIYDVMAINKVSVGEMPFHERFKLLEKEVIEPRNMEREALSKTTNPFYRYDLEPFSVRRKDFWLLSTVDKLLKKFIPKLPHEADGLIFQGWDDPYVPRTHEGLLKWKYIHMNSVDFLFETGDDNRPILYLFDRGRKTLMEGNTVVFNDLSDVSSYSGKIIECSWDSEGQIWVFMRVRADKSTPNDISTYKKVMRSITDNITEEVLFKEINEIIHLPMYAERIQKDIRAHQNTVSSRRK